MKILMPYILRSQTLLAYREHFRSCGHACTLAVYESAEKLRKRARIVRPDVVLSAESTPLLHAASLSVPLVYAGSEFHCADRRLPPGCAAYWTAHADLDFAFMTCGAQQKRVHEIGIPLTDADKRIYSRGFALHALGLGDHDPVFSILTDGVSPNEIKATVRSCSTLCPSARLLLWSGDGGRRSQWQSTFADLVNVYVPQAEAYLSMSIAAADAVFTPAFSTPVCAVARQGKIVLLLHAASVRARRNAQFLDSRGIAFCGKTAADNVSYACRLLDGARLRRNMTDAQEKYILRDAEMRAEKNLTEIVQS